jgi:hypothetical protein
MLAPKMPRMLDALNLTLTQAKMENRNGQKEKRCSTVRSSSVGKKLKNDQTYRQKLVTIAQNAAISPSRLEKFMRGEGDLTREELLRASEDAESFKWLIWYTKFNPVQRQLSFPML